MEEISPLDIWRNIKHGTLYQIRGLSKNSETLEDTVEYTSMSTGEKWNRPKALFLEKFTLQRRSPYAKK